MIVRARREVGGKSRVVDEYLSTRPITDGQRRQARQLDAELRSNLEEVEREVRDAGYLDLKGRPGVIRLWWEVGRRLRAFVPSLDVGPAEDERYIWRAMYDHGSDLVPGVVGARAERLLNSHFRYCYLLGEYEWSEVEAFGDWTSWVEVFDSERIRADPRIARWLVDRVTQPSAAWAHFTAAKRMAWFRPLAKAVRARFAHRDTTVLSLEELYAELDSVAGDLIREAPVAHP